MSDRTMRLSRVPQLAALSLGLLLSIGGVAGALPPQSTTLQTVAITGPTGEKPQSLREPGSAVSTGPPGAISCCSRAPRPRPPT
jgi:hypothetical protein